MVSQLIRLSIRLSLCSFLRDFPFSDGPVELMPSRNSTWKVIDFLASVFFASVIRKLASGYFSDQSHYNSGVLSIENVNFFKKPAPLP